MFTPSLGVGGGGGNGWRQVLPKHSTCRNSRHFILRVVSQTVEPERAVALGAQQVEAPGCTLDGGWGVPARLGDVALLVGDVLELLGERFAVE